MYIHKLTTMECTIPSLAQANMATQISIIIGIYIATRSPFFTPEIHNSVV